MAETIDVGKFVESYQPLNTTDIPVTSHESQIISRVRVVLLFAQASIREHQSSTLLALC